MANSTPPKVAASATTQAPLPSGIALLGVRRSDRDPRALVRLPDGRVMTVGVGTQLGRQKIVAIDEDRIALSKGGAAEWIELP
ncbi:amidophosphoribosyltransferase [Yangia mangrovi]|uniref:Amidophosphoribosyltransferase n=1 Tax=Alloyangia mangrovi TaxID=1779329 RepID=A0A2A3JSM0_9RHOB|nr:amidophosphoribosyltransferase [Alloyangia mangrovi]MCT4369040.1 amidophosphoribosyltransferase [Alloyangia mangrovi]